MEVSKTPGGRVRGAQVVGSSYRRVRVMERQRPGTSSPHSVLTSCDLTHCSPFPASPFSQTPFTARRLVLAVLQPSPPGMEPWLGLAAPTRPGSQCPTHATSLRPAVRTWRAGAPSTAPSTQRPAEAEPAVTLVLFCHLLLQRLDELQPSSPAPAQLV